MGNQLKVKNFRCLRDVDWSPDGVCMLVGPNGSGKSTLFDALKFLWLVYKFDAGRAVDALGGFFFRTIDAPPHEPVHFALAHGPATWEIDTPVGAGPFFHSVGERFFEDAELVFSKRPQEEQFTFRDQRIGGSASPFTALQAMTIMPADQQPRSLLPIIQTISGFIVYGNYWLFHLRHHGSQFSADMFLQADGLNAFTVLRNWRDRSEYRSAYEFVLARICEAFPNVCDYIDFENAGQITSLRLGSRLRGQPIPALWAPNGWLTGLIHLMAVVGAAPGTVVVIDEFENSLHPYAIRSLVQSIREWAAEKDLTVVLAGHSPALLDEFKECPSQVFVMEPWRPGQPSMPRRLTDYHDPEWLKHFSLGELYRHQEFGSPNGAEPTSALAETAS